ncbi:prepilin peptidase [uncultured Microbacterium sp.]|uniref:prepilin peptidase n=1 Tax=uncultured Microbacterium sp. TaxID=191216 RepID=UPI00261B2EE6|nr:A24 family peptidase [uncultured Microbacterium sp.]
MPLDLREILIVIAHAALAAVGLWLVAIDARTHRLPNRIVLPATAVALVLIAVDAAFGGSSAQLLGSLLGMFALGGFYLLLRAISRGGIGGGDVKLALLIGLVLGWNGWAALVIGAAAAFVLGAVYALLLMTMRRADRTTRIPFGPWMIAGAIIGLAAA